MAVIVLSMSFALSKQGLGSTTLPTVNRQNLAFAVVYKQQRQSRHNTGVLMFETRPRL